MNEENDYRFYTRKKYESPIGSFVLGSIFVFVAILALIFLIIKVNFLSLRSWGYWMLVPAFFIFLGGFQQYYTNLKYQKAVKNAIVQQGKQETYKLEHLSLELGIKPNDILRVLLDLRNKKIIKYRFNPDTGDIITGQNITYQPSKSYSPPEKKLKTPLISEDKNFCLYCGHNLDLDAKFCPNCGSKM